MQIMVEVVIKKTMELLIEAESVEKAVEIAKLTPTLAMEVKGVMLNREVEVGQGEILQQNLGYSPEWLISEDKLPALNEQYSGRIS